MTVVSKMFTSINRIKQLRIQQKHHETIKLKPADVQPGMYVEYDVECNDKVPKFKVGDHVRISN